MVGTEINNKTSKNIVNYDLLQTIASVAMVTCVQKESLSHRLLKHCQRHNGPEGWVQPTKETCLGHITSSDTNLDQASTTKSQPNISILTKLKLQNIDQI